MGSTQCFQKSVCKNSHSNDEVRTFDLHHQEKYVWGDILKSIYRRKMKMMMMTTTMTTTLMTMMSNIRIMTEMVSKQTIEIQNWKCPGPDEVQGY